MTSESTDWRMLYHHHSTGNRSMSLNSALILAVVYVLGFFILSFAVIQLCRRVSNMRSAMLEGWRGISELNGRTTSGLDPAVIAALPTLIHTSRTSVDADEEAAAQECTVCLSKVEEGEELRVLPKCLHRFHVECVDLWLGSHSTCPICRTRVMRETSPAEGPEAPPTLGSRVVVVLQD